MSDPRFHRIEAPDAVRSYQHLTRRRSAAIACTVVGLVMAVLFDVLTGPAGLTLSEVLGTLLHSEAADPTLRTIVWTFRLPTALMALLVGAALGIAGAEMQTILNNPLASPFTLGVSAAASFGAALAIVFGSLSQLISSEFLVPVNAFLWALICAAAIYGIGRKRGGSTETVVVGGVALHFLFSSGVAFLQYVASEDALQSIVFWIFGSLQGANWSRVGTLAIVVAFVLVFLLTRAWQLTALRLGDEHARSLGIEVQRLRMQSLVLISVLTATAVCFTGAIGFIGLVAPHLARMTVGEDQRFFLPLSALYGALLVSVAALLSKVILPGTVFPIGIATAAIGAPFFAGVALLKRRAYW